jgi:hypothetical protein
MCNLQLLLALTSSVPLVSAYRPTHDHIIASNLGLSCPGGPGPRIYISQE